MAIGSEGETSYRGGAGGKFQKRPARRHQTTPYDRPPSIVRNPRPGGWVSKLFDPASRFISARAFKFFSNFRKRITEAEAEQEPKDGPQVLTPNLVDGNEACEQDIACNGNINNSPEGSGISELEQMLQQKTFTRSEVHRLTELLHSRTTESSCRVEEKTNEGNLYKSVSDIEKHDVSTKSPLQENRDDDIKLQRNVTATGVSSKVLEDNIASPAELAKAYMGRSSKVSPSMLGVRAQAFKEETPLLNHGVYPSNSSALSLVSKSVLRDGAPEMSFITPRSRGRSAIFNMARTPYSKGTGSTNYIYAGPSSSSSPQSVWEHNGQLGSKQLALKRRSSVLDDDTGSVGAIRRIRQKPNLLNNTSVLSARGTDLGHSVGQRHISSSDKPLLLDDKNKVSKNKEECEDDSIAGFRYPLVHSQSRQMASKILQHLEKFTPQKSSESKINTARDKSPIKLTSNMLRGQALRSLENADSTKYLEKQECGRLEDSSNALQDAGGETSQKKNILEENGFKVSNIPQKLMASSAGANATSSMTNAVPNGKNGDSIVSKFAAQPPQKKRAFRMTANEDFPELDDETYTNGFASGERTEELQIVRKSVSPQATAVEKMLTKAEGKMPEKLTSSSTSDHKLSGWPVAAKENNGIQTPAVVTPISNFQQDVNAQSTSVVNNSVPSRDISFSLSSKNVDTLPSFTFSSSPSGDSANPIPTSWSDSSRQTSNSFGNDTLLKSREVDKVNPKNTEKSEHVSCPSENLTTSAVLASTASAFVSSTIPSENLNNGLVDSKPFSHLIPPKLPSSNSTEQGFGNSSTTTHSPTSAAMTSGSTSISSPSIFAVKSPSFPIAPSTTPPLFSSEPIASPIFAFGQSKTESSPVPTISTVTGADTTEMKSNEETLTSNSSKPPSSGTFAMANAGNNPFGFSTSFASSSTNQSQVSLSGFGSSSAVSSQLSPTTGASTATQNVPFQFGSTGSSTVFGTSGTSFTTNVSVMGSSALPANPFGSGTTSLSTTSSSFSSVAPTNPFGSSASSPSPSPSPSPLFSFGASQTASATSSTPTVFGQSAGTSVSTFSFTSPTAATSSMPSLSQSKLVFGGTTAMRSPGNSGDQMNMEDSMAEDPVHSSNPAVPVFGQPLVSSSNPTVPVFGQPSVSSSNPAVPVFGQPLGSSSNPTMPTFGQPLVSPSSPGFMFGPAAPSSMSPSPFQFGGQQNQATPQNLSSFQASNSLVNSGGSFSLGSGGGDKGNRKMVRISKNKNRRK